MNTKINAWTKSAFTGLAIFGALAFAAGSSAFAKEAEHAVEGSHPDRSFGIILNAPDQGQQHAIEGAHPDRGTGLTFQTGPVSSTVEGSAIPVQEKKAGAK